MHSTEPFDLLPVHHISHPSKDFRNDLAALICQANEMAVKVPSTMNEIITLQFGTPRSNGIRVFGDITAVNPQVVVQL
jgi:hypothetical protein